MLELIDIAETGGRVLNWRGNATSAVKIRSESINIAITSAITFVGDTTCDRM